MTDLTQFLRDRYTEARKAEGKKWRSIPSPFDGRDVVFEGDAYGSRLLVDGHLYPVEKYQRIATEPAPDQFTLDDLDAKLAIVAAYLPPGQDPHPGQPCINYEGQTGSYDEYDSCSRHLEASKRLLHHDYVLRLLARPHREHPDFDPDWLND